MLLVSSVFLDCFSDLFFLADTEGMEDWVSFLRVATLVFALVFALVFPYFPTPPSMWEKNYPHTQLSGVGRVGKDGVETQNTSAIFLSRTHGPCPPPCLPMR